MSRPPHTSHCHGMSLSLWSSGPHLSHRDHCNTSNWVLLPSTITQQDLPKGVSYGTAPSTSFTRSKFSDGAPIPVKASYIQRPTSISTSSYCSLMFLSGSSLPQTIPVPQICPVLSGSQAFAHSLLLPGETLPVLLLLQAFASSLPTIRHTLSLLSLSLLTHLRGNFM